MLHWRLLRLFVRQDLAQRYAGNVIGVAWTVLAPLLQLALFAVVFVYIFKARVPGLQGAGYVAFLALGMWPWFAFSEAITRGCSAVSEQAGLLNKVSVPASVLIAARVTTPFLLHGLGFLSVLLVLPLMGVELHWRFLPLALLSWLPLLVLALSIGTIAAVTQVFVRDMAQIIGHVLAAWMFLSPILYAREMAPARMSPLFTLNPVSGMVESVRDSLLFGRWDAQGALIAWLGTLLIAAVAVAMYRRTRPHLQDFL